MHVFVTGGSGLTGPAIVAELIAAGHTVTGLARSDDAADRLKRLGAEPLPGSLDDLASLRAGARASDGVIHMAFGRRSAWRPAGRSSSTGPAASSATRPCRSRSSAACG
jgi:nucleoside-diphosphate-sugar epimerase